MSDRRWVRLLLWASASAVVAGLVITALLPGPVDPAVPGPGFGAGPVSAGTPATAAWGDVAGLVPGIDPDSANPCQAGRLECLDLVVAEMEARLELHPCEHTAHGWVRRPTPPNGCSATFAAGFYGRGTSTLTTGGRFGKRRGFGVHGSTISATRQPRCF